jgi:hypothetical protein
MRPEPGVDHAVIGGSAHSAALPRSAMCAAPGARAGATVTVRRLPQARHCGCFTHIDPGGRPEPSKERRENFTVRLAIDVTPDLCGRINVAAFRRGITIAETVPNAFSQSPVHRMSELTHVLPLWIEKQIENRIRFDRSVDQHINHRQAYRFL